MHSFNVAMSYHLFALSVVGAVSCPKCLALGMLADPKAGSERLNTPFTRCKNSNLTKAKVS